MNTATEPKPKRKIHRRALEIRPPVVAFCFDGRTAIPAYLSTHEAAEILGVGMDHLYQLIHKKRIAQLARGAFRVSADSVLRYRSTGK